MTFSRLINHLWTTQRQLKRSFSPHSLTAITSAIREAESLHTGEIRFALEAALQPRQVISGMAPRGRALDVFSQLRVWDTEHNNGVLIYVLLADKAVEIIVDRGMDARTGGNEVWQRIANSMQKAFTASHFEAGAVNGVAAVARELRKHFPANGANPNELPDEVTIL